MHRYTTLLETYLVYSLLLTIDNDARRLFIRGIPFETRIGNLEKFFEKYGELEDCTIVNERGTGKSRGFGFVVFKDMDAAYAAIDDPNKDFEGRRLIVNLAAMRDREEGGGGGGSSVRCILVINIIVYFITH